jgi:dolichyl-phosphate-mannose-protein mannosyltransferase
VPHSSSERSTHATASVARPRRAASRWPIVAAIVAAGLALRAAGVPTPISDPREAHSAMIARNLAIDGPGGILYPRVDYGREGGAYVAQEFPLVTALGAVCVRLARTGADWPLRLPSLAFYVLASLALFDLARRRWGDGAAIAAVILLAFFPLDVERSPSPMTDEAGVALGVAALALLDRALDSGRLVTALASAGIAALSFLAKVPNAFLLVPMAGLVASRRGWRALLRPRWILAAAIAIAPAIAWMLHAGRVNLRSDLWTGRTALDACVSYLYQKGRFGYYLSLLWYGRIASHLAVSLTWLGLGLALAGAVAAMRNAAARSLVGWWSLGLLGYVVALPASVFLFEYYMLPVVPLAALLGGIAIDWIATIVRTRWLSIVARAAPLAGVLALGAPGALAQVRGSNSLTLKFGARAARLDPERAPIVVSSWKMGPWDCSLLYAARRRGWKFSAHILDESNPEALREIERARRRRREVGVMRYRVPPAYSPSAALRPEILEQIRQKGAALFGYYGPPGEWLREQPALARYVLSRYPVVDAGPLWLFVDLRESLEAAPIARSADDGGGGFSLEGSVESARGRVRAWRVVRGEEGTKHAPFGGNLPASALDPGTIVFERVE